MATKPKQPPEAALIARKREEAPRLSRRAAAARAGISEARWRQLEDGYRTFRGQQFAEVAPAPILARMARAVGVTPAELEDAARPDAAAELVALPPPDPRYDETGHRVAANGELTAIVDRLERIERMLSRDPDNGNGGDAPRRAG